MCHLVVGPLFGKHGIDSVLATSLEPDQANQGGGQAEELRGLEACGTTRDAQTRVSQSIRVEAGPGFEAHAAYGGSVPRGRWRCRWH